VSQVLKERQVEWWRWHCRVCWGYFQMGSEFTKSGKEEFDKFLGRLGIPLPGGVSVKLCRLIICYQA
jgi:hypothetical protein